MADMPEQAPDPARSLSFAPHGPATRFVACKTKAPMTARVTTAPSTSLATWGGRLRDPPKSATPSGSVPAWRICQHLMRAILSLGAVFWKFRLGARYARDVGSPVKIAELRPDGLPRHGTSGSGRLRPYPRDYFVLRGSRSVGFDPPLGRQAGRACCDGQGL